MFWSSDINVYESKLLLRKSSDRRRKGGSGRSASFEAIWQMTDLHQGSFHFSAHPDKARWLAAFSAILYPPLNKLEKTIYLIFFTIIKYSKKISKKDGIALFDFRIK
jgi:hypothetical protein